MPYFTSANYLAGSPWSGAEGGNKQNSKEIPYKASCQKSCRSREGKLKISQLVRF